MDKTKEYYIKELEDLKMRQKFVEEKIAMSEDILDELERKAVYYNMRKVCEFAGVSYSTYAKKDMQGIKKETVLKILNAMKMINQ